MGESPQPNLPPDFEQLLAKLAEETSFLAIIVRAVAEGTMRGDSPKKIKDGLRIYWHHQRYMLQRHKKDAQDEANVKALFFGQHAGDKLAQREYIHKCVLDVYSDIINMLPDVSCERCGHSDSPDNEVHLCASCEQYYCQSCFGLHECTNN